jgi:ubiquinone/menaquinone biosynthesis C-methylase UbiE
MAAGEESTYEYFVRDDVVAEYASLDFLFEPEKKILDELRPRLADARMLDVGVGAGRTTVHFAPLVREYVGVDVSAKMVEACERRFARLGDRATFLVADARDMAELEDESFDIVLFSFNGLDIVGDHEERLRSLLELHRVCREDGTLVFSAHNLAFAESSLSLRTSARETLSLVARRPSNLRKPRRVLRFALRPLRRRSLNPGWRNLSAAQHALVVEERPRYEFSRTFYESADERIRVRKYYVRPREQIRQLSEIGFAGTRILAPDGTEVPDPESRRVRRWWWLYYVCTKRRATPA